MFSEHFVDLDELLLRCRNDNAKKYIQEAILCYKIGAFRASIVSTWVAIVYDFVDKLRELSYSGDANANEKLSSFRKAQDHHSPTEALKFEKNILDWSLNEFKFISPIQKDDLDRLVTDRNRCAHPSMMNHYEIYKPSAEQARLHIKNAVLYFLQYPPTQGKSALDELKTDIFSQWFPQEDEQALQRLKDSPLSNAKPSLLSNFIQLMCKEFLIEESGENEGNQNKIACSLNAIRKMYPTLHDDWKSELNKVVSKVTDNNMGRLVKFLVLVTNTWDYLRQGEHIRIITYVKNIPSNEAKFIAYAIQIPQLRKHALLKLPNLDKENLALTIKECPDEIYFDYALEHYEKAETLSEVDFVTTEMLIPLTVFINVEYATKILQIFTENPIIKSSTKTRKILKSIENASSIPKDAVDDLFKEFEIDNMIDFSITRDDEMPY